MTHPLTFTVPLAGPTPDVGVRAEAVPAASSQLEHQDQSDQRRVHAVAVLVVAILLVAGSAQMGLLWTAGVIVATVGAVVTFLNQRVSS